MDMRHRLSISFKKEHRHLYEYLKSVPNKSDFISKAIDAYLNGGHSSASNYEYIRKTVIEILQNEGNPSQTLIQSLPPTVNRISDEDIDMIAQLF